jgi:hypothetical protein
MFPWRLVCDKPIYDLAFLDYSLKASRLRDYVPEPTADSAHPWSRRVPVPNGPPTVFAAGLWQSARVCL